MLKNSVFNGMSFVNIVKFCFEDIQLLPLSMGGVNTRLLKNPLFNGMSFVNIVKFCFEDIQLLPLIRGGAEGGGVLEKFSFFKPSASIHL